MTDQGSPATPRTPSTEAGPVHDNSCRCWPHVSQQDAVKAVREAFVAGAVQEYREHREDAEAPGLREALKAIVDNAEADDNFEGEFIDYLVPYEFIDTARKALAAAPAAAADARPALEALIPERGGAWGEPDESYEAGWNECRAAFLAALRAPASDSVSADTPEATR